MTMRVFVSSTSEDLNNHRKEVIQAIHLMNHTPVAMEYFPAADATPLDKSLDEVASCHIYVGIFAKRYGFIPEGYDRSITELEYREAVKNGIPALVFLLDDSAQWSEEYTDTGEQAERLRVLREELMRLKTVRFFKDRKQLPVLVTTSVSQTATEIMEKEFEEARHPGPEDVERQKRELERLLVELTEAQKRAGDRVQQIVAGPVPGATIQHFQDRIAELRALHERLEDPNLRVVLVCGRGGTGKTALITKLVREVEEDLRKGTTPDDRDVDGIVFADLRKSEFRSPDKIVELVRRTLDAAADDELRDHWRGKASLSEGLEFLFTRTFAQHRYLIVLDNFESVLDKHNAIFDEYDGLRRFVEACLEYDHSALLMATSRRTLVLSPEVEGRVVGRRDELSLDRGLPEDAAVDLLRELDADGQLGIREAPEQTLREVVRRCEGIPRTLETLVGTLGQRRTRTLQELLADESGLARLLENPARELYDNLSGNERLVVQALAVYNHPVPAAAVRHILPALPVDDILDRLVRNYVIIYDRGRFSLHPLDQAYAYHQIPEEGDDYSRPALHQLAVDFFQELAKPVDKWQSIDDVEPQLRQFYHLVHAGLHDTAARLLGVIDRQYLWLWGYAQLVIEMRETLRGHLEFPNERYTNAGALGWAYWSVGRHEEALVQYDQAIAGATESGDFLNADVYRHNESLVYDDLGDLERALQMISDLVPPVRTFRSKQDLAATLGDKGVFHMRLGQFPEAIRLFQEAEELAAEANAQRVHANNLDNLAIAYLNLQDYAAASRYVERALAIPVEVVGPYNTYIHLVTRARVCLALGDHHSAIEDCEAAISLKQPALRYRAPLYMALAHWCLDDPEAGVESAQQAVESARSLLAYTRHSRDAQYFLAIALLCAGQAVEALKAYGEALDNCSARGVVRDALLDLQLLRNAPQPPQGVGEAVALLEDRLQDSQ